MGGGAHPLHPPPRFAPDVVLKPLGVATPHGPIKSDLGP